MDTLHEMAGNPGRMEERLRNTLFWKRGEDPMRIIRSNYISWGFGWGGRRRKKSV